jgi:hypothetical protein
MANFRLLAHPWWVNLLLLVPLVAYFLFRREKPQLTSRELLMTAMFALSFGFVELPRVRMGNGIRLEERRLYIARTEQVETSARRIASLRG